MCVVSVLLSFIIYPEAFELDEGGSGLEFGRREDMEVNGGLRTDVGLSGVYSPCRVFTFISGRL